MKFTNINKLAQYNLKTHISENFYPGRGIVLGRNLYDSWILIYWIMGRSNLSKNRVFKYQNGVLRTEAFDSSLLKNPDYIIYNAMRDLDEKIIVTNGDHTDTICEGIKKGDSFFTSLKSGKHEFDIPNYTPRIAGIIDKSTSSISFLKISKSDFSKSHSSYHYFKYPLVQSGYGYCITTYMKDGNPPISFEGDPILLPLNGNAEEIGKKYWNKLNSDTRVSLFAREIFKSGEDNFKIFNSCENKNLKDFLQKFS